MQKAATKKTETKAAPIKENKPRSKSRGKDEKAKPDKAENNIKKAKAEKEESIVKRNKNAYMFFTQENREKVKKDNPDLKSTEILSQLGKMWGDLNEAGKKKYNDMALKDKERYLREKENCGQGEEKKNKKTKQVPQKNEKSKKSKGKKEESESESEEESDS